MKLLDGRVAVVTAAAGAGIGASIAETLAAHGASVAITDVHEGRAEEVATRIAETHGVRTLAVAMDVTNEDTISRVFADVAADLGRLDVLVNNAGINKLEPVWEMSSENFRQVVDVCLTGTFLCSREALKQMVEAGAGSIVNIASIAGWDPRGSMGQAHYAAAKAGVMGFTRAAAIEAAPRGVRVNAVAPGFVPNPFLERVYPPEFLEARRLQVPLGRVGEPSDIADAVLFLASDLSRFVVGETLSVSGGLYMNA